MSPEFALLNDLVRNFNLTNSTTDTWICFPTTYQTKATDSPLWLHTVLDIKSHIFYRNLFLDHKKRLCTRLQFLQQKFPENQVTKSIQNTKSKKAVIVLNLLFNSNPDIPSEIPMRLCWGAHWSVRALISYHDRVMIMKANESSSSCGRPQSSDPPSTFTTDAGPSTFATGDATDSCHYYAIPSTVTTADTPSNFATSTGQPTAFATATTAASPTTVATASTASTVCQSTITTASTANTDTVASPTTDATASTAAGQSTVATASTTYTATDAGQSTVTTAAVQSTLATASTAVKSTVATESTAYTASTAAGQSTIATAS